ncbi:hypothetical protein EIP86_004787 [Pleurotus ostreatoroseus]|nr:hypothetical protein EIP86_004787 [Pleurotus ostreatoroseus]
MFRRRTVYIALCLLAAVLVGTVIVLSSVSYYVSILPAAYITEAELDAPLGLARYNASQHGKLERVPRIIHQTWKTETLPDKWVEVSEHCREIMPDYEYMLWTDEGSREFIAQEYPWFLETFDGYTYPIQRADAIRYFVLYHFGGVYVDLDIGCLRPMDSLLTFPVILPRTDPLGISNDLMVSEKHHPFLGQVIRNLIAFDYSWVLNYPTVMFSTGPMFLSIQYGHWTGIHPATPEKPGGEVRVLPKSLYGKNMLPQDAPHSFFSHYYGSSWHADDAAFIAFLGHWGKILMWVGLVVLVVGLVRLALVPHTRQRKYSLGRIGGYEVMMPRWRRKNHRWYLDLGWFAIPSSTANTPVPSSPISLSSDDEDDVHLLPLSLSVPPSPSLSDASVSPSPSHSVIGAVRRAASGVMAFFSGKDAPGSPSRRRSRRSRGVLFFLPAFFSPSHGIEVPDRGLSGSLSRLRAARPDWRDSDEHLSEKSRLPGSEDVEDAMLLAPPSYDAAARSRASSSAEDPSQQC